MGQDALLILRQRGRLVNARSMFYSVERDFDQEVRYIAKIWFVIMLVFIPVWYYENPSQPIR
ncbi:MAG: hypothetical protein U9N61_01875 [Euryarchaeota archaeon]|nr:hypothetical protein [Euryarchaeota archaeon]